MGDEELDYIDELSDEVKKLRGENMELSAGISSSAYHGQESNLIQYQLDTGDMLEKIEHFLKGDTLTIDAKGNEFYTTPTNTKLILFNAYGVNSIMSLIGNYIDKNTTLSRYTEERINEILADLGDALADFIFCNYEIMGMDTSFKKTRFALTVLTIIHSIESAYRRAIGGKTMEDLNQSRIVTQGLSDNMGRMPMAQKKPFNFFKPGSWGK